jgi:hypothetical protein
LYAALARAGGGKADNRRVLTSASRAMRGSARVLGRIASCGCWRADAAVGRGARLRVLAERQHVNRALG